MTLTTFHKNRDKGFTLIELLLTVIVISVLMGVSIGLINFSGIRSKMRDSTRISDLRMIQNALEQYFVAYRRYPEQDNWNSPPASLITGGYIKELPQDPLFSSDNNYRYYYRTYRGGNFYVLIARMENESSTSSSSCEDLRLYRPEYITSFPFDVNVCFGVESPTVAF